MKTIRWILMLALVALFAGIEGCRKPSDILSRQGSDEGVYYTCSMHPQVHEKKPGACPLCGMALVPVSPSAEPSSEKVSAPAAWTCSMCPEVRQPGPGACPKCGMDLEPVKAEEKPAAPSVRLDAEAVRQGGVQVEAARRQKLTREVSLFGTLGYDQNRHHDVVPLVSGRVERQLVDYNQAEVKKGDPLVSLYSPEALSLQEEYLKALRERWLSTFYERRVLDSAVSLTAEKLRRIGFSVKDLKRLQDERKTRAVITLRSPATGTLVENLVRVGEYVKADQALYHIASLDELWLNASAFESDLGVLSIGQKARIITKPFPGEEFEGKLVFIGRSLNVENRTVPVRFAVPNPRGRLLPNLSATVVLEAPIAGETVTVPASAVLDLGARRVVYVQKEKDIFELRNVRVGQAAGRWTQILEGVREGEEVVAGGAFLLDAQSRLGAAPMTDVSDGEPDAQPHNH